MLPEIFVNFISDHLSIFYSKFSQFALLSFADVLLNQKCTSPDNIAVLFSKGHCHGKTNEWREMCTLNYPQPIEEISLVLTRGVVATWGHETAWEMEFEFSFFQMILLLSVFHNQGLNEVLANLYRIVMMW